MDEGSQTKKRTQRIWLVLIVIGALCLIEAENHGNELVYAVPSPWRSIAMAAGFLIGLPLAIIFARTPTTVGNGRKALVVVLIPLLSSSIASYYARRALEAVAFWNLPTPEEKTVFEPIVDMYFGRGPRTATVQPADSDRMIHVFVSAALMQHLDAFRHPGRDCLILVQQTGNFGIKRLILPGYFSAAVDITSFRPCSAQ